LLDQVRDFSMNHRKLNTGAASPEDGG